MAWQQVPLLTLHRAHLGLTLKGLCDKGQLSLPRIPGAIHTQAYSRVHSHVMWVILVHAHRHGASTWGAVV